MRRGAEVSRLRGRANAVVVRDLLLAGRSLREICEETGLSRRCASKWRSFWVRWAAADPSPEERAAVRASLRVGLRKMLDAGVEAFVAAPGPCASAGAVALRAVSELSSLYGLAGGAGAGEADQAAVLSEIAASVRGRAGLLSAASGGDSGGSGVPDVVVDPPVTGPSS